MIARLKIKNQWKRRVSGQNKQSKDLRIKTGIIAQVLVNMTPRLRKREISQKSEINQVYKILKIAQRMAMRKYNFVWVEPNKIYEWKNHP